MNDKNTTEFEVPVSKPERNEKRVAIIIASVVASVMLLTAASFFLLRGGHDDPKPSEDPKDPVPIQVTDTDNPELTSFLLMSLHRSSLARAKLASNKAMRDVSALLAQVDNHPERELFKVSAGHLNMQAILDAAGSIEFKNYAAENGGPLGNRILDLTSSIFDGMELDKAVQSSWEPTLPDILIVKRVLSEFDSRRINFNDRQYRWIGSACEDAETVWPLEGEWNGMCTFGQSGLYHTKGVRPYKWIYHFFEVVPKGQEIKGQENSETPIEGYCDYCPPFLNPPLGPIEWDKVPSIQVAQNANEDEFLAAFFLLAFYRHVPFYESLFEQDSIKMVFDYARMKKGETVPVSTTRYPLEYFVPILNRLGFKHLSEDSSTLVSSYFVNAGPSYGGSSDLIDPPAEMPQHLLIKSSSQLPNTFTHDGHKYRLVLAMNTDKVGFKWLKDEQSSEDFDFESTKPTFSLYEKVPLATV